MRFFVRPLGDKLRELRRVVDPELLLHGGPYVGEDAPAPRAGIRQALPNPLAQLPIGLQDAPAQ